MPAGIGGHTRWPKQVPTVVLGDTIASTFAVAGASCSPVSAAIVRFRATTNQRQGQDNT